VVKAPAASRARQVSRPQPAGRTIGKRISSTASSLRGPIDDVGVQRIYHVTHVDNLASILESGNIYADLSESWGARPTVDISSPEAREARRAIAVTDEVDTTVASYVPFALSPKSSLWESVVVGAGDPRLSASVARAAASDFVMLVSTVKQVIDLHAGTEDSARASIVASDRDAAHPLATFAATRAPVERMLRKLRADTDGDSILNAELLVEDSFPIELLTLIGVANDRSRDAVKSILADAQYRTKVAVYPPWFRPAEEDAAAE